MQGKETGTIKWFDDKKGFGFIQREQDADVFVHYSNIRSEGFRSLSEGQNVEFNIVTSPKGLTAENVVVL